MSDTSKKPVVHEFEVWSELMGDITTITGLFEFSCNDCGYQNGDYLKFIVYNLRKNKYPDKIHIAKITYVLDHTIEGFVTLGLVPLRIDNLSNKSERIQVMKNHFENGKVYFDVNNTKDIERLFNSCDFTNGKDESVIKTLLL